MEWWQGFWGWLITTAFAAMGAGGFVLEVRERQRNPERVSFTVDRLGTVAGPDETWDVFVLANVGNRPATSVQLDLRGVERRHDGLEFWVPGTLAPLAQARFACVGDVSEGYIVLTWISAKRASVVWYPLDESGPLGAEHAQQVSESLRQRRRPWGKSRDARVGPGGRVRVDVNSSRRNGAKVLRTLSRALTGTPGPVPTPSDTGD